MFGPKRFGDLRSGLPGVSANVLTQRLEGLEAAGILHKTRLAPPASVQVYELTEWGYESEPILQALGRWAARSPGHDPNLPISTNSFLLSLRTMLDGKRRWTCISPSDSVWMARISSLEWTAADWKYSGGRREVRPVFRSVSPNARRRNLRRTAALGAGKRRSSCHQGRQNARGKIRDAVSASRQGFHAGINYATFGCVFFKYL